PLDVAEPLDRVERPHSLGHGPRVEILAHPPEAAGAVLIHQGVDGPGGLLVDRTHLHGSIRTARARPCEISPRSSSAAGCGTSCGTPAGAPTRPRPGHRRRRSGPPGRTLPSRRRRLPGSTRVSRPPWGNPTPPARLFRGGRFHPRGALSGWASNCAISSSMFSGTG